MNCPACETQNRPGAQRCKRCAAPLPPSCYGCGIKVDAGVELCGDCRTERLPASLDPEELFPTPTQEATVVSSVPYDFRPRFVGRKKVLERLQGCFHQVATKRELSFVALIGAPGAGKSRVVKELARRLKQSSPETRFLLGQADRRIHHPYGAVANLLSARFGITSLDSPDNARDKIIAGVGEVLSPTQVAEVSHLIAHLMGVDFPDSPIVEPLAETPQQLQTRTFIAVKRFLAADARRGALVLCLDNLERAGSETVNLLHYLAAGLASEPILLLALARPSLYEVHPGFGEGETPMERVELGPLDDAEGADLLRELLRPAGGDVPTRLAEQARKLGGLPRTLVEAVRLLVESNVIVRDPDAKPGDARVWKLDRDRLDKLRLPTQHEDILAERLRQMSPGERDLLEKAAACGEVFWLDAVVALVRVAALSNGDPDGPTLGEIAGAGDKTRLAVAQSLARLVEREWITESQDSEIPGEREFHFAYPPLWDVVYDGVDETTRRYYHRAVAQWLELRPDGRGEEVQEQVGRHLERAGDSEGAAARYRRAADEARARFRNEKAIRLYAQALACLGEGDLAARIHLWHDLGSVYELKGDLEAAIGAFERMLRLTWVVSSRTKAAVAFNKMGRVWRRKGDLKVAGEYLQRALDLFQQARDIRGIAGSYDDLGNVRWLEGKYDEAFDLITKGLQARGKQGDKRSVARSLSNLGNLQKDRGKISEAENCHRESLALRRAIGDRPGVIGSLNNLGVLAFERKDYDGAHQMWNEALKEAEEIGALPLQALAQNNLGELALTQGKQEEARRRLEDAAALGKDCDDRRLQSDAKRNLCLLELESGNPPRARALAEEALDLAESSGLKDYMGRALLALGEVHAATLFDDAVGDDAQPGKAADKYFQRGIDLFRELGNDSELAKGLERYGRYKLERGDTQGGQRLLKEAHGLLLKLGMQPDADLAQLASRG